MPLFDTLTSISSVSASASSFTAPNADSSTSSGDIQINWDLGGIIKKGLSYARTGAEEMARQLNPFRSKEPPRALGDWTKYLSAGVRQSVSNQGANAGQKLKQLASRNSRSSGYHSPRRYESVSKPSRRLSYHGRRYY